MDRSGDKGRLERRNRVGWRIEWEFDSGTKGVTLEKLTPECNSIVRGMETAESSLDGNSSSLVCHPSFLIPSN